MIKVPLNYPMKLIPDYTLFKMEHSLIIIVELLDDEAIDEVF